MIQTVTFDDVWRMFQETDLKFQETYRRMKETDRQMKETDRQMKETDLQIKENAIQIKETGIQMKKTDRKFQETDRKFQETDRKFQETDLQMKENAIQMKETDLLIKENAIRMKETDRKFQETDLQIKEHAIQMKETDLLIKENAIQMKETDRQIEKASKLVGNPSRWGEFVEGLVAPSCVAMFAERGIPVDEVYLRVEKIVAGERMLIDILVANNIAAVLVEVNSHLQVEDVRIYLNQLERFKALFTRYASYQIYGAVAGIVIDAEADKFAMNKGLFVIVQSGETVKLANGQEFNPRIW